MIAWALLCLAQGTLPTVGDTIWVERRIPAPAGAEARAPAWTPEGDIELLGTPVLRREGDQLVLAFPLVAWQPGSHVVMVPGPVLIRRDGHTDSLPPERQTFEVASILPAGRDAASLPIQPPASLVPRRVVTPVPVLATIALAGGLIALMGAIRRRRGPLLQAPAAPPSTAQADVVAWIESGEPRAVAALATRQLRHTIASLVPSAQAGIDRRRLDRILAEQRQTWPVAAISAVLAELEGAGFGDTDVADLRDLYERARDLSESLPRIAR
jgi:hypothetical protein